MAYARPADLRSMVEARSLAQLTGSDSDQIDDVRLQLALDHASAEVDGYLRGRYSLPLEDVPDVLAVACLDIALYRLHLTNAVEDVDSVTEQYKNWIIYLKSVAEKKRDLILTSKPESDGLAVLSTGAESIFSRSSLRGF